MNSAQLDLWEADLVKIPWRGQSPRALTQAQKSLFLRREPQKDDCFFVDPEQLGLFHEATKTRPRHCGGAPLLLPF